MTLYAVQRDGKPVSADELAPLAFSGYAHFTAAQVRGGKVRGLDLHLERLREASMRLFGRALPDERIRAYLRAAITAGPAELSLTATVYSPEGEFTGGGSGADLRVLVRTGPPESGPRGPLSLAAVEHERALPAVKHVGEVAKTLFLREAVAEGFDDAAFVDRRGRLSEGTIWNLAFWDGESVVWPRAEMLRGITMGVLRRRLEGLGIAQRELEVALADLSGSAGAVVMNSWTPGVAVRRIGRVSLPVDESFVGMLHRAYESEPLVSP